MINLTSCFPNRETKIISNYCYLHEKLKQDIDKDVILYWEEKAETIKNKKGSNLTVEEKFFKIMVDYAGANDKKYYDKDCDKI